VEEQHIEEQPENQKPAEEQHVEEQPQEHPAEQSTEQIM
jgi:hypothetical protein